MKLFKRLKSLVKRPESEDKPKEAILRAKNNPYRKMMKGIYSERKLKTLRRLKVEWDNKHKI